jgi:hypothetical protein
MKAEFTPPSFRGEAFHCPHCGVFAHQDWYEVSVEKLLEQEEVDTEEISINVCENCGNYAVWVEEKMVHPTTSTAPLPVKDMPDEIIDDFIEARYVYNISPRSASALLRLTLYKLVSHLGEKGESLSEALKNLEKKGLDIKIQKALESVRVTGRKATPPGQINERDDRETALILFNLVNLIVDSLITQPRMVDELLEKLPNAKKKERDFLFRARIS